MKVSLSRQTPIYILAKAIKDAAGEKTLTIFDEEVRELLGSAVAQDV